MPEIEFIVRRHADKAKGGEEWGGRTLVKDEVSPKGYGQANRAGVIGYAHAPRVIILRRVSNAIRTRQTSDEVMRGAVESGARLTTIAPREDANFFGITVADKAKWAEALSKGEDEGIRKFFKGHDVGLTENPRQLGERYATGVKSLLSKVQMHLANKRANALRSKAYVVDVTAHSPGVGALAAYLLGRHESDGSVKLATASLLKMPERLTEEVRITMHVDDYGQLKSATAHFRDDKKDVTKLFMPRT